MRQLRIFWGRLQQTLVLVFFFQIIGQLQEVEGFADVETHNFREYKNS